MFPSSDALVGALIATISVGLASILVFHPVVRDQVSPAQGVLAPTWALVISQSHAGSVFADGVKSILGSLIGVGCGLACYALTELMPIDDSARHVTATVLAIPFALLICLGDPVLGSPLGAWMKADAACLSLYIVASFSKLNGYRAGLSAIIAFSYGSACAMVVSGLVRLLWTSQGSTKRRLSDALYAFRASQTHWLEGLTGFMTSASGDHGPELDMRQEAAVRALGAFQAALGQAKNGDPFQVLQRPDLAKELSIVSVLMHSQLLAFRDTITPRSYREDTMRAAFNPIADQFNRTRMVAVLALRPTTSERVSDIARLSLNENASELYRALISNATLTATNRSSDLPQGDEVVRLHFVIVSLIRFSLLLDRFLDGLDQSLRVESVWRSLSVFYAEKARNLFTTSCWLRTGNRAHAFRSVLSQQIVAQMALLVARQTPNSFGPYVIWAQLPVVFCFLSTFGGSLIKGSRRVLGTLVGGAIGCVSAAAHAGSESSFWLEMLMFAFIGKVFSYHANVGYAGPVFAFTWFICMLGNVQENDQDVLLHAVFYRMVLTVAGVVLSYIFSVTLFPSFSGSEVRRSMSKAVATGSQLIVNGIRRVVEGEPFDDDPGSPGPCVTLDGFKGAGDVALRSMHKYIVSLPTMCVEAKAEIRFKKTICCCSSDDTFPSMTTLVRAEESLYRFIDAVLVLTATAAATRVSRHAHALFFTDQVVLALHHFVDKVELAGTRLSAAIHGEERYELDHCFAGDRIDDVDRNLMAVRRILGQSKKLAEAVKGGSPLIYVFHFALCEMADRWDDLVRALEGVPDTISAKPERFRRISSSHSSLNII